MTMSVLRYHCSDDGQEFVSEAALYSHIVQTHPPGEDGVVQANVTALMAPMPTYVNIAISQD